MVKRRINLSQQKLNSDIINSKTILGINKYVPPKGASSGLKTINKYLLDFERIKAGHKNKKGNDNNN